MKTRRKLLDNKGAALVTILIAVTFMTIMASSLMYMAYMNYLTKSMRYSATDNFYTDEFALDDLATSLQQVAAGESSMSNARTKVRLAIGATTQGAFNTYTPADVENLITIAKLDANVADITVEISPRLKDESGNLKEHALYITDDMIKLCGVQITVTTQEGYVSTITSDIEMDFPNTMPGSIDINDFSIITESRYDMSNGGSRVCSGNVFIQNYGSNDPAMTIGNSGSLVLLSPQAMVVGDILVTNHSELHITGTCIVYGKITVENGSALIVSGDLKHEGRVICDSSSTLIGVSDPDVEQTVGRSDYLDSGLLTTSIFKPVMIYGYFTSGVGGSQFRKASFMDLCGAEQPNPNGGTFTVGTGNIQYRAEDSTTHAKAVVYGAGQGNNFHSEGNSLIMLCTDVNISSQMNFENTTVLTTGLISYNNTQGTAYMTKMTAEAYEAAKNLLFYPSNPFDEVQISIRFDENTYDNGADYKVRFASGTVDDKSGVQSNSSSHTLADSDGERTFVAASNSTNYLPIGYFINENSSEIMTNIYAAPTGAADPKNSTITYRVWSKD